MYEYELKSCTSGLQGRGICDWAMEIEAKKILVKVGSLTKKSVGIRGQVCYHSIYCEHRGDFFGLLKCASKIQLLHANTVRLPSKCKKNITMPVPAREGNTMFVEEGIISWSLANC